MSSFKKKGEGFEPNWWYVLAALVLGLIIPDKLNPLAKIASKFGGSDTTTPSTTKKEDETKK